MTEKKFELPQTNDALAELSDTLVNLNNVLAAKKNGLKNAEKQNDALLKSREKQLALLKEASENVLGNIDKMIVKLDKVLENNGTGNDNN